jgi:catalase (peroxidase I)
MYALHHCSSSGIHVLIRVRDDHGISATGTFNRHDGTGGSNGGTIRFEPESTDPANAGLHIIRDLLLPTKVAHPEVSHADLIALAGAMAIEFVGGPYVPVKLGRTDDADGSRCPANGRLPDALQGAAHLRGLFGERMGFSDREIVALSGAHTLGRCHKVRSGFDGPWTTNPLRFDNEYFRNLIELEWRPKQWDGPLQYEDTKTGDLMMLPTDLALVQDAGFKQYVEIYARDGEAFARDFSAAFAKLLALGCPASVQPDAPAAAPSAQDEVSARFREYAMHGSVLACKKVRGAAPSNWFFGGAC